MNSKTHPVQLGYSEVPEKYTFKCIKCKSLNMYFREIDEIYGDHRYWCGDCNYRWEGGGLELGGQN